ncbi:esterase/lipase family protein [Jejudonia soesokkakensis]|uniref:Esterase/lipase family protein n=1 Tax=Jejudonia soesokkakensis TaxID=1323432 RepID=A0ABW2MRM6_9FLAO
MANNSKEGSDLQGLATLLTDASLGITDLVEAMHKRIVNPPFIPSTPIQHLITNVAGVAYKNIKRGIRMAGKGLDKGLGVVAHVSGDNKRNNKIEIVRAVLNGLVGDYLEEKENPLAIEMEFRFKGENIQFNSKQISETYPKVSGKILVMVHGSCMNDTQWTQNNHNHGIKLAEELHATPVFLYYNTGLHISTNGQKFNESLEDLIKNWPVPVQEINMVAHSMGGLVLRSAIHYGFQKKMKWTKQLAKIIFLGTPHHGAPMERIGHYVDGILEFIPYTKPFARLGKMRSAGVTDLRYGAIVDEDWDSKDRFEITGDQRQHSALPQWVDCYAIAAVNGKKKTKKNNNMSDGLVYVKSALGQHKNPVKDLNFNSANTQVIYNCSHRELLSNPEVFTIMKNWWS